jgi:RNA polymerase sigma-70 factor (ECF subfamily)
MLQPGIDAQPEVSDEVLAARAREGARSAFIGLVTRYQSQIYRVALRMSHSEADAEEITQDTFFLAYRGVTSFHGDSRFPTWLYRIAVNQALMRRRSAGRRPLQSIEARAAERDSPEPVVGIGSEPPAGAEELVDQRRLAQRVREALAKLDDLQRAALVLRDLEGLTAEEAADVLGVSPELVRQRAHRARLRLRELLSSSRSALLSCS